MASYFLAPSLVELRNELNFTHRTRDKSSDGWIGDTAHQARKSDHNPDYAAGGIVRAIDIDKDGIDTATLLRRACADPRVEYVIWNRKIYTRQNGFRAAAYTGSNPHDKHMHISIRNTAAAARAGSWGYAGEVLGRLKPGPAPAPAPKPAPAPARKTNAQIAAEVKRGLWGNNPERSRRLQAAGYSPTAIQAIVNGGGGAKPKAVRLSIGVLADQVIKGQWGNGAERERRITQAGYNYAAVRAEVNRRL